MQLVHRLTLTNNKLKFLKNYEINAYNYRTWWTLTGNYGNILPIDWSKSYVKQMKEKVLHIEEGKVS